MNVPVQLYFSPPLCEAEVSRIFSHPDETPCHAILEKMAGDVIQTKLSGYCTNRIEFIVRISKQNSPTHTERNKDTSSEVSPYKELASEVDTLLHEGQNDCSPANMKPAVVL